MTTPIDRSKFVKEITAPFSGQKILIRRVSFRDFLWEIGGASSSTATVEEALEMLKAKSNDAEAEEKTRKFYLTNGVVSPKIWFGNESERPPDQIYYLDLGPDIVTIVGEIIDFSTMIVPLQQPGSSNGTATEPAKLSV